MRVLLVSGDGSGAMNLKAGSGLLSPQQRVGQAQVQNQNQNQSQRESLGENGESGETQDELGEVFLRD